MLPLLIHQIVGPNTNEIVNACLESWQSLKARGFEIKIWDDLLLEEFIRLNYPKALCPFLNATNHAEAADIGRYLIVYHYGGHYFDWDIQLLDENLFLDLCSQNPRGYLLVDPTDGSIASEAFASEPMNAYLDAVIDQIIIEYHARPEKDWNTLYYSGPFRMRETLALFPDTAQSILEIKDVFLYDYHQIKEMPEPKEPRAMIHYWLHSWIPVAKEHVEKVNM